MAFKINSDCNNCGACEPECPNNAISMGSDLYEIKVDLCTECVGFNSEPQCAVVCPVDACHVDPAHVETEDVLLARAKQLNPTKDFSGTLRSHFKK